jgi:hypothetical protein
MTEQPQDQPAAAPADGPTRDIMLPPLPGHPPPQLPREWAATAQPETSLAGADQPTVRLGSPNGAPRQPTLAFSAPEMSHRPAGPVRVASSRRMVRHWPWVLGLLPVVVIVGSGVAWLLLVWGAS